jgi:hypothetical protein
MKLTTVFLIIFQMTYSQTFTEMVISDTGTKSAEDVISELPCLTNSKWNEFFQTHFPGIGVQFIRDQMSNGATLNKKYYIKVDETHNVMYFKLGSNYFMHLNKINEDGSEHLLMRGFVADHFGNCIQILPESCKWKGQREVKYIEICEKGLVQAEGFAQDFVKVILDEEDGEFTPLEIAKAVRDCYKPKCYSIAYKCFQDGLYFDPVKARKYLEGVRDDMVSRGFKAFLDLETMSIKYQKLNIEVNGVAVGSTEPQPDF